MAKSRSQTYRQRMSSLSKIMPPPPWREDARIKMAYAERLAEMDIGFRLEIEDLKRRLPLIHLARIRGGSGLPMAEILRHHFNEYFHRFMNFGPHSLPTSFNVVEAFLEFDRRYTFFDLRPELDHLLDCDDYFDWYTSGSIPHDPRILMEVMDEGVIYSYNMTDSGMGFQLSTKTSTLAFLGISLIRHANELSAILLAGESPPNPPDSTLEEEPMDLGPSIPFKGKEEITPNPKLGIQNRYLPNLPGFGRVLLLTRIDLAVLSYDSIYINIDIGNSFAVLTNDRDIFHTEQTADDRASVSKQFEEGIERYKDLLSGVTALIYLPVIFIGESLSVVKSRFATELGTTRNERRVRQALKELGSTQVKLFRSVKCLSPKGENKVGSPQKKLEVPDLKFESNGYWRPIPPNEIGTDREGTPIVGKTWVERHETWSAQSLGSFIVERQLIPASGPESGTVYVMRSPAHTVDVYKVGITKREVGTRAQELGATSGSPLPFGVLASCF